MSILDRYIASHTKVFWNTDKKKESAIRDRQGIVDDFNAGHSLAHIIDAHALEPKYHIKKNDDWAVMEFTDSPSRPIRCERPCIDDSVLFQDPYTREAVAITYRRSVFEQQIRRYWGLSNG